MSNQEYEQKRRECWENFCDEYLFDPHNIITQGIFDFAFDRAYALGKQETKQEIKQETNVEGEEMLVVPRSKVIEVRNKYAAYVGYKLQLFLDLFGSKCLPDEEPKSAEPKDEHPNLSQDVVDCDKHPNRDLCDKLIQQGSHNHNRLHIAAMAMQGLLANDTWMTLHYQTAIKDADNDIDRAADILKKEIAEDAIEFTDALIKEAEK